MLFRVLGSLVLIASTACTAFGEAKQNDARTGDDDDDSTQNPAETPINHNPPPASTSTQTQQQGEVPLAAFTSVRILGGIHAVVSITDSVAQQDVRIDGEGTFQKFVGNSELVISGSQPTGSIVTITILVAHFSGFVNEGNATVTIGKASPASDVHVEMGMTAAGEIHFTGDAEELSATVNNHGNIHLRGGATKTDARCYNDGTIIGENGFSPGTVQKTLTGPGEIDF